MLEMNTSGLVLRYQLLQRVMCLNKEINHYYYHLPTDFHTFFFFSFFFFPIFRSYPFSLKSYELKEASFQDLQPDNPGSYLRFCVLAISKVCYHNQGIHFQLTSLLYGHHESLIQNDIL